MDNITDTNDTHRRAWHSDGKEEKLFRLTFAAFLIIIFFISIGGGLFVCHVMKKNKMFKKKCWLYLLLLALSDISSSLFAIPILVAASIDESILQIRWICCYSGSIAIFFGTWQIYAISAISVHRYITIMKPLQSLADTSYSGVIFYIIISLMISSFFALSPILGFGSWTYMKGRQWCILRSGNGRNDQLYSLLAAVFVYIIPLSIIIVSALRIYCVVRKQKEIRERRVSKIDVIAEQNRLVHTLSLLIGTFFAFWTPSLIYFIAGGMARVIIPLWYSHIVYLCMFIQNCVNPVIYCFRHKTFGDELRQILSGVTFSLPSTRRSKSRTYSTASDKPMRTPSSSITSESQTMTNTDLNTRTFSMASISTILYSDVLAADKK